MTNKAAAILALLALPDPSDLEPRTHVLTVEGKPDRAVEYQSLPMRFTVYARVTRENERTA